MANYLHPNDEGFLGPISDHNGQCPKCGSHDTSVYSFATSPWEGPSYREYCNQCDYAVEYN